MEKVRHILGLFALFFMLLSPTGCASTGQVKVYAANVAKSSKVLTEEAAIYLSEGQATREAECRQLELRSKEERAACMGVFSSESLAKWKIFFQAADDVRYGVFLAVTTSSDLDSVLGAVRELYQLFDKWRPEINKLREEHAAMKKKGKKS